MPGNRLTRAQLGLCGPECSLSWSILMKVKRSKIGSLWVHFSVGFCPRVSAPVQAWWRVISVEILKSHLFLPYPMVMPKPHWNLFLRWLRKAPRANDRGRGISFFSSVAPTTQLLSKEPEGGRRGQGHSVIWFKHLNVSIIKLLLLCYRLQAKKVFKYEVEYL